jgi:hypothetical protein
MLQEEGIEFLDFLDRDLIAIKKQKVLKMMEVARERGTLERE